MNLRRSPTIFAALVVLVAERLAGTAGQFTSAIDLVQVDVVVTDQEGAPVRGLTAEDFTIVQDSRQQRISHFQPFEIPLGARAILPGAAIPADAFHNIGAPASRALAVVIDNHHLTTDAEQLARLRRALIGILEDASDADEVAIVFTGRSDLGVPLTRDFPRQVMALDGLRSAAFIGSSQPPGVSAASIRSSLWTVRNVIRALAGSSHSRRAVLFVSEGPAVELGWRTHASATAQSEVKQTLDAAIAAGVVVHAIDPRGTLDAEDYERRRIQRDFLSALVLDTGGSVVGGAAETRAEIGRLIQENGTFYVLGYTPEPLWRDGKFHRIKVSVRNPEWRVKSRSGYRAPGRDASSRRSKAGAETLAQALAASQSLTGVLFRASAVHLDSRESGEVETGIVIAIEGQDGGSGDWDVAVAGLTPDGAVQNIVERRVRTVADDSGHHEFNVSIPLRPGVRPTRVAIRNRHTGSVGSVHLALNVPNLARERLAVAAIIFGRPLSAGPAAPGALPVEPTALRTFEGNEVVAAATIITWDSRESAPVRARAFIRSSDARVVNVGEAALQAEDEKARVGRASASWALPLGSLRPGRYVLHVICEQGERQVMRAVPFAKTGGAGH